MSRSELTVGQTLRQELRFVHNALKIRLTNVVLGFVATPMFKGKTNQSEFLSPLLHVDTVGEAIVDAVVARESRSIWLPATGRFVALLVGGHRLSQYQLALTSSTRLRDPTGSAKCCGTRLSALAWTMLEGRRQTLAQVAFVRLREGHDLQRAATGEPTRIHEATPNLL